VHGGGVVGVSELGITDKGSGLEESELTREVVYAWVMRGVFNGFASRMVCRTAE